MLIGEQCGPYRKALSNLTGRLLYCSCYRLLYSLIECLSECLHTGKALLRLFRQSGEDHLLNLRRKIGPFLAQRRGRMIRVFSWEFDERPGERTLTSEPFIGHN